MSRDIYQILESLDAAQKSVKQLPALFRPKDTSPQLSGPYPGKNAASRMDHAIWCRGFNAGHR